ncbi:MAG: TonB-dependent receptor [Gemmatimonadaceae bacterium]|nr:TonB-dependent receptor [Gemmatimonadaceae bacterium]
MKRNFLATLALALCAAAGSADAQTPAGPRPGAGAPPPAGNGEVMGMVIDTTSSAPIPRASVAVRMKADSSLVAGAIATSDGAFRIQGLRPGAYTLRVASIGFRPKVVPFTIAEATPRALVGKLALSHVAVTLQGVEVQGERPTVAIEPDRNSYRAKDVAPAAGTASDVLQAVPSVEVDADGKVSLRGNENVAVQINGRPSPIRGAQLGAYLRQLPATIVERIEVVPNPSARHDPEGMAGILNIVLKQGADLGISGGVTLSGANTERYNGSGNLGYQEGNLTLFGSYGFNSDGRGVIGINDRERFDALRIPLSYTEQEIDGSVGSAGHNLNTTADYKLNSRDVLSNGLSINKRRSTDESLSGIAEFTGGRVLLDQYNRFRDSRASGLVIDNTLSLKRTFEPRVHELGGEIRYNRSSDDDETQFWRQSPVESGSLARLQGENNIVDALSHQLNGQVDYTRNIRAKTKLETGYKGIARWLDRDYLVEKDALGTGNFTRSELSNAFQFDEQIHAVYGVLSQSLGKLELQGGLRAEQASRDFSLATPAESYPYSYSSLFPSGVIRFKPSDATELKASYSRRIRRPGTQELNPFPVFFDAQNVFIGNPLLDPEYTDAIELGASKQGKFGSLQISPFYRHTTDIIRVIINTAGVIDGRDVTSVTFENLANANSWGTDLNGSLRLGPKFNGFASFNVFKLVTDGGSESALSSNAVTWSYRLNATTQLSPTLTLQGMYNYRAPVNIERARFSGSQSANVSLRKKIYGDKASVAVRFVDPFNTIGFKIRAGDDNLTQITERKFGVRATYVTFQYNFGQAPKIRPPRQDAEPQAAPVFQ